MKNKIISILTIFNLAAIAASVLFVIVLLIYMGKEILF